MTGQIVVRRVLGRDWRTVRDLRLEALHDPAAAIAFLDSAADAQRRPNTFWQQRTRDAADGRRAAQFFAESVAGDLPGTATVLRRDAGEVDHLGHALGADRSDVVGVYVRAAARGTGVVDSLSTPARPGRGHRATPRSCSTCTSTTHERGTPTHAAGFARRGCRSPARSVASSKCADPYDHTAA